MKGTKCCYFFSPDIGAPTHSCSCQHARPLPLLVFSHDAPLADGSDGCPVCHVHPLPPPRPSRNPFQTRLPLSNISTKIYILEKHENITRV